MIQIILFILFVFIGYVIIANVLINQPSYTIFVPAPETIPKINKFSNNRDSYVELIDDVNFRAFCVKDQFDNIHGYCIIAINNYFDDGTSKQGYISNYDTKLASIFWNNKNVQNILNKHIQLMNVQL